MGLVYFYIVSLILFLLINYFDKSTVTVRQFFVYFWMAFVPVLNTFCVLGVAGFAIDEYLRKKYRLPRLRDKWSNFLNKKLWKPKK